MVDRSDRYVSKPQQTNTKQQLDAGVHTAVEPRTYHAINGEAGSNASNKPPSNESIVELTRTSKAARRGRLQQLDAGVHTAVEPRTYHAINGEAGSNASNKPPSNESIVELTRTSEAARRGSLQRLPSGR
jgi:hypothetical protein